MWRTLSSFATTCAKAIGRKRPPCSPTKSSSTSDSSSGASGTACWTVQATSSTPPRRSTAGIPMISVLRRRLKVETQQKNEPRRPVDSGSPPPSDEELDHMIRDMPPGTVESFVQVVQPILLNHCPGAIGYTLPGQKRLQLLRPPVGESPSRRITQRNLYAVLECIDSDNPGESLLLKASVGSGTAASVGSFPRKHSEQYEKLVQWVYLVAQKPMPAEETDSAGVLNASFADLAAGAPAAGAPGVNRPAARLPSLPSPKPGTFKSAAESASDGAPEGGTPAKPSAGHPSGGRGALKGPVELVDPYDPAAFNNQADAPATLPTPAARVLHGN